MEGFFSALKTVVRNTFDTLIGADGIYGYTWQHILGAGHPALKPVFAGI
jgi:hypothetical protein